MKQVLQESSTGDIAVLEVPAPKLLPGCVLVRVAASLLSAGTERASNEFASKNLLQKAKARPDLVREVMDKVRRDGVLAALAGIRSRLDRPAALGYSSAGTVIAVAEDVNGIEVGDRVACAGAGYAIHGEIACVPRLLVAKLPEASLLSFEEAAFTTLGAVALHGIRTADVKLGDLVAVIGLGLVGQLTVQLLKAAGCIVIGMDIDPWRARLASELGADVACSFTENFQNSCLQFSAGRGVDSVLITAETASSDPVNLAAVVARDRGTIVAVGTVGMDLERKHYYEKELEFRLSRSYGPGRYDTAYEQKGRDYPIGYVRWTETRNMEAFLQIAGERRVDLKSLITHRFPIEHADSAYSLITGSPAESFLGVVIQYPEFPDEARRLELVSRTKRESLPLSDLSVGVLGAGNFAVSTLIPAIRSDSETKLVGICAANGANAHYVARKFSFQYCATDESEVLNDPEINTIAVCTRHHLHALQVLAAIRAGKHIFCEKPLCLNEQELEDIVEAFQENTQRRVLMVGFNRRFSPITVRMKAFLAEIKEPLVFHYRVNAGPLHADHWINDPAQGGGRILGEVCHFVDLLGFLAGAPPVEVRAHEPASRTPERRSSVIVSLRFANGSHGTISYLANGDKSYCKERLEAFGGGSVAVLEDFRRLDLVRNGRKRTVRMLLRPDKGHRAEWAAFSQAVRGGTDSPIPFEEIVSSTLATLRISSSLSSGEPVAVDISRLISSFGAPCHLTPSTMGL